MPDQDRKSSFIHTLRQDLGDGARCPSCRGTGVTFQADCVCCGREVLVGQVPKVEDITDFVKTLSIKGEVVIPDEHSFPQSVITSFVQENKPVIHVVPADRPRPSDERQRRSHVPTLRRYNHSERGGVGSREGTTRYASLGQLQQQQHSGDCRRFQSSSSSSSSRRGCRGAGRGTGGAHGRTFKGVRTREGVKGFLVEIRPPKWKKTIWLGTYNTSVEAAGAYDAGVFYTNKPTTKYNFPPLAAEGAFPPLPAHLRLDRADNMDEIKLFVQNQARVAARRQQQALRVISTTVPVPVPSNSGQPTSSGSCLTGSDSVNNNNADLPTCTASHSIVEIDSSEFQNIPMDLDYIGQCLHEETVAEEAHLDMFLDYTNYLSQQARPDLELLSD